MNEPREPQEPKELQKFHEPQELQAPQEVQVPKEYQEPQGTQEPMEPREPREPQEPQEPQEQKTPKIIMEEFKTKCKIKHYMYNNTLRRVINRINQPIGSGVLIVVGPTGVGKTYLKEAIVRYLCQEYENINYLDPSRIPVAALLLRAPLNGRFSWPEFFEGMLTELREPLIPYKVEMNEQGKLLFARRERNAARVLRASTEKALMYRNPKVFILDEGQHLLGSNDEKTIMKQLDVLKSLADVTGVLFVILGHYGLQKALDLNGQLIRRSDVLYFAPYKYQDEDDMKYFKEALIKFKETLPIKCDFDIESKLDYFMLRSAGCIGILRDWFVRALSTALEFREIVLNEKHFDFTVKTVGEIDVIMKEIDNGEEKLAMFFQEDEIKRRILQELILKQTKNIKKSPNGQLHPGRRKPTIDKV